VGPIWGEQGTAAQAPDGTGVGLPRSVTHSAQKQMFGEISDKRLGVS